MKQDGDVKMISAEVYLLFSDKLVFHVFKPFHDAGLFLYFLKISGGIKREVWHEMGILRNISEESAATQKEEKTAF